MTVDVPHMLATMLIVFLVVWGLDQTPFLSWVSGKSRTLIKAAILFVAIFVLNLTWPYGGV